MLRNVAFMALGMIALGCGADSVVTPPPPPPPPPSPPSGLVVTSVSPDHAFALSPDVTVTITGSGFEGPQRLGRRSSWAVWRGPGTSSLATTFVSDTLLTAVVPATLLRGAASAHLVVQSGDPIAVSDGVVPLESNAVAFVVMARDPAFSVAPASAAARSDDLTITVRGTHFLNDGFHDRSLVELSVNGTDTGLATTFISSSELSAVIPAALLAKPGVAVISVWTGDPMGDSPGVRAGAANFTVIP